MTAREKVEKNAVDSKVRDIMDQYGYDKEAIRKMAQDVEAKIKSLTDSAKLIEDDELKVSKILEAFQIKKDFELSLLLINLYAMSKVSTKVGTVKVDKYIKKEFCGALGSLASLIVDGGQQFVKDIKGENGVMKDSNQYEFYKLSKAQAEEVTDYVYRLIKFISGITRVIPIEFDEYEKREELLDFIEKDCLLEGEYDRSFIEIDTTKDIPSHEATIIDINASKAPNLQDLNHILATAMSSLALTTDDLRALLMTTLNLQGALCSEKSFSRICDRALSKSLEVIKETTIDLNDLNKIVDIKLPNSNLDEISCEALDNLLSRVRTKLSDTFTVDAIEKLKTSEMRSFTQVPKQLKDNFLSVITKSALAGSADGNGFCMNKFIVNDTVTRKAIIASMIFQLFMIRLLQEQDVVDGIDILSQSFIPEMSYVVYEEIVTKIEDALKDFNHRDTAGELAFYEEKYVVQVDEHITEETTEDKE